MVLIGRTEATAPWDHGSATTPRPPRVVVHLQAAASSRALALAARSKALALASGSRALALAAGNPMVARVSWVHARRPTLSSLHLQHLHPLQHGIRPTSSLP